MAKPDRGLVVDYTALAETYDSHRYEGSMAEFRLLHVLEIVTEMVRPTTNMKILDVATGTGKGALALAGSNPKIVGLDFTHSMLQIAQRKSRAAGYTRVHFVKGNAAELPFPADEFDAVISLNFLHLFLPVSRQKVLTKEMHRVLRPGGTLVIELINLYQGILLGLARKRFGADLGFNAPGDIRRILSPEFKITKLVGGHLPVIPRLLYLLSKVNPPASRFFAGLTKHYPWKYIAYNLFVQAIKT